MDIFEQLSLAGLVPVIKVEDARDAVPLCRALASGGLPVAEITFRTAAAEQAIQNVHAELPETLLGAGTVLTVEQVQRAVAAGASYIVSPGLNPEVVGYCVEHDIPVLPGCANPSDIERALGFGLKLVKFFPAEALGGVKMISAMGAPYGGVRFVPTGGINEKNALDYLNHPKVAAIGGSWIVPSDAVAHKDWDRIESLTREAVRLLLGYEVRHVGVNCADDAEAIDGAKKLCALFGWPLKDGRSSAFAGTGVEFMKGAGRGAMGHIGVWTNSVPRAMWHLTRQGVEFHEPSVKNGRIEAAYLKGDIAGFAVHLLQK